METRTGEIYSQDQLNAMDEIKKQFMKEMAIPPTERQIKMGKVGRNDPCPCGSRKKFKHCCLISD